MRAMKDIFGDVLENEIFPRVLAQIRAEKRVNEDDEAENPYQFDDEMRENMLRLRDNYNRGDALGQVVPGTPAQEPEAN